MVLNMSPCIKNTHSQTKSKKTEWIHTMLLIMTSMHGIDCFYINMEEGKKRIGQTKTGKSWKKAFVL